MTFAVYSPFQRMMNHSLNSLDGSGESGLKVNFLGTHFLDPRYLVSSEIKNADVFPYYAKKNLRHEPRQYEPQFEWIEQEDSFLLNIDVPGFREDEIDLHVAEGVLTVSASTARPGEEPSSLVKVKSEGENSKASVSENQSGALDARRHRQFKLSFRIGHSIDLEKMSGQLSHGVLSIHLAKLASMKPRIIKIGSV